MAPYLLTSEITVNMLISKEGASCCPLMQNITLHYIGIENSPHVRESRKVLDSGFLSLVEFRIPWAVFRITNARISDSISKIFADSGIPRKRYDFRDGDDRSSGCGILAKKCGNAGSEPLSLPDPIYKRDRGV